MKRVILESLCFLCVTKKIDIFLPSSLLILWQIAALFLKVAHPALPPCENTPCVGWSDDNHVELCVGP